MTGLRLPRVFGVLALIVGAGGLVALLVSGAWRLGRAPAPAGALPAAPLRVAAALAAPDTRGFARALAPRPFVFPADHGPHPDYRTEWWYYTGNLAASDGRRFGFQLTFFRTALAPPPASPPAPSVPVSASSLAPPPPVSPRAPSVPDSASSPAPPSRPAAAGGRTSAWAARQVWFAHLAVTDAAGRRFLACERWERQALGLAGARASPFRVWVGPWSAAAAGPEAAGTPPMRLTASSGDAAVDLVLATDLPPVAQGDRGLSAKSGEAGNASYYYSLPRLTAAGTLRLGAERIAVRGAAWMDREWSTSALAAGEVGWDWFALQLDDGWELMIYRLRRSPGVATAAASAPPAAPAPAAPPAPPAATGIADPASLVTLIAPDGRTYRFPLTAMRFTVTGAWTSPASHVRYPAGWRLTLPAAGPAAFDLAVQPLIADQELRLSLRYWEGAVTARGTHGDRPVTARGYVELTGYGEAAAPPARPARLAHPVPAPAPTAPAGTSGARSQPLH
ncbi:MAG TPA: lipocalin-like domain-containing protein [Thermoanaerobaculia bacterium]|nr:lipocalin-like domain-containing protein [Thermoanaerobaculia bacterium]